MATLLQELESFEPLHSYHFGHTPFQIEHFQTLSQKGNDPFTYWQHVLQLKSLYQGIKELSFSLTEALFDLKAAQSFWPPWSSRRRRAVEVPRLEFKIEGIKGQLKQKEREANEHLRLIREKYQDYVGMTEEELFAGDRDYWVQRLGRQLLTARLARALGIGEGDLGAIIGLPGADQSEILKVLKAGEGTLEKLLGPSPPPGGLVNS